MGQLRRAFVGLERLGLDEKALALEQAKAEQVVVGLRVVLEVLAPPAEQQRLAVETFVPALRIPGAVKMAGEVGPEGGRRAPGGVGGARRGARWLAAAREVLDRVRPDMEVLARENPMRVLPTVAANASFAFGSTHRFFVRQQVSRMRLKAMLVGSPDE